MRILQSDIDNYNSDSLKEHDKKFRLYTLIFQNNQWIVFVYLRLIAIFHLTHLFDVQDLLKGELF